MAIDSYEKFCRAFAGTPAERWEADILLFLQDWMVTVLGWADDENGDYGLDRFLDQVASRFSSITTRKDAVSRLVDNTEAAVRRITEKMRSTIVRENILQPVYKVHEVNSYGLNWLSRRPGRTVREKISNSHASMMAVRRRQSVDTGENRLFLAFLREMSNLIDMKASALPMNSLRPEESDFAARAFLLLQDPELFEIRRWENLPPNNTLLSDQNYKKIWQFWNEMKELDEIVAGDVKFLDHRLAVLFFVFCLAEGKKFFAFPQVPVFLEYRSRKIQLCAPFFRGVDAAGKLVEIGLDDNTLVLRYCGKECVAVIQNGELALTVPGEARQTLPIETNNLVNYASMVLAKLGCSRSRSRPYMGHDLTDVLTCGKAIVDLFQVRPHYAADGGEMRELNGRILFQRHSSRMDGTDAPSRFALPCDQAQAIEMTAEVETYSVISAVEDADTAALADLARLLGSYLKARHLAFLFPDAYNTFQVSMIHKALRLAFAEVASFPRSMGAAFFLMRLPDFRKTFQNGDFLLVLDLAYDALSLTLVQSSYDGGLAKDLPEYGGLFWERHPTETESLSEEIRRMTDSLLANGCLQEKQLYKLLGFQGVKSEADRLSVLFDQNHAFRFGCDTTLSEQRIAVTELVSRYLEQHKQIIGRARVHIVSLSNVFFYKGMENFRIIPYDDAIRGYQFFEELQLRSKYMLWKDHLPELAIKLLYGKFPLVKKQTVQPAFNLEKKIPIEDKFTLPNGKKEYRFILVSNSLNRKTQYAAVVRNPAFPLLRDIVCRLDMTYRYGAEEPYRLIFIPEEPNAGFAEAKVSWEPAGEYPYQDLPYPEPLPPLSWKELSCFDGRNGEEDLINGDRGVVNLFQQISKGYTTIDLEKYHRSMILGIAPKRYFYLNMEYHGQPIRVRFSENALERSFDQSTPKFDDLHTISFQLTEDKSIDQRSCRYTADLTAGSFYGSVWRPDKNGRQFCIRDLSIAGSIKTVAFFETRFDRRESFSPHITNVSFELDMDSEGRYLAKNIHDESKGPYQQERAYWARLIREGDAPPFYLYNGRAFFLLHAVFGARKSIRQADAPPELGAAFENAKEAWLRIYQRCMDSPSGSSIFALMSLCASDLGTPYYIIANALLDKLTTGPNLLLQDYMGYALGDYTSEEERALLDRFIILEKKKPLRGLRMLSKAAWGNPDFIMNVEKNLLLDYFDSAAHALKQLCEDEKFGDWHRKDITVCLEYLLAVYRLRSLGDERMNRYLSRNRPVVQDLYHSLEVLVGAIADGRLEIRSFLRLDISSKGIYQDIPDLLYALLIYVTGDSGAGDIKIAGLSLENIEMS